MKRGFLMLGISLLVAGGLVFPQWLRAPQADRARRRIRSSSAMCNGN